MSKPDDDALDDLEAVRKITEALKPFDANVQERIIRWAKEKLGLPSQAHVQERQETTPTPSHPAPHKKHTPDIKTFMTAKSPVSDTHFASTVAYFYKFEANESERKDSIAAEDLQDACRKVGRNRLKRPLVTLNNARRDGFLDRAGERGKFSINTVGENLVAMTLPGGVPQKTSSRKKVSKKAVSKRTQVKGK